MHPARGQLGLLFLPGTGLVLYQLVCQVELPCRQGNHRGPQLTLFGCAHLGPLPMPRLVSETVPVFDHVTSQVIAPAGGDRQASGRAPTESDDARITPRALGLSSLDTEQIQGPCRGVLEVQRVPAFDAHRSERRVFAFPRGVGPPPRGGIPQAKDRAVQGRTTVARIGVVDCNRNGSGLQSARFWAQIKCH